MSSWLKRLSRRVKDRLASGFERFRVRKSKNISASERETCESYGEHVIGTMLAGGFNPSTEDLLALYQNEQTREHARDWLRERSDYQRRHERWIEFRELFLELTIIGLIVWEIQLGYRQETQQSANFTEQQRVLTNMLASSQSTAATLATLQSTTQTMSDALQKQLGLFYDVSVNVIYLADTKEVGFSNSGRTNLVLWAWGSEFMNSKPIIGKEGRVLVPGGGYKVDAAAAYQSIVNKYKNGASGLVPFEVYMKNERQEEFIAHCYFSVSWKNDTLNVGTQTGSVTPEHWSRKYPPSR